MAIKDVERFKIQKAKDVKEILIHYAIMQIEQCKKVRPKHRHTCYIVIKWSMFWKYKI